MHASRIWYHLRISFLRTIPAYVWLLVSALFFAYAEYLSKRWAIAPSYGYAFLVVVMDVVASVLWLPALLHRNELALMGTIWLILATISTVAIGLLVFHEHLTIAQWTGVVLSVFAFMLLSW